MIIDLLCEYRRNPVGVDISDPLLLWSADRPGFMPELARVTLSREDSVDLLWDSGFMPDEGRIRYTGPALKSGRTYRWHVTLRSNGEEYSSPAAHFTTGVLPEDSFPPLRWVGGIRIDAGCYLYRHELTLTKHVRSAAIFMLSPNYNVLTVNGNRPDDSVLNNIFADPDKSMYYVTYNVTGMIHKGRNALGVMTGRGWRSLREAEDGIGWGDSLFALWLLVEYADGTEEVLASDPDTWRYSTEGPVTYNSIYNGETYDARLEIPGWDRVAFRDDHWFPAVEKEPPEGVIRSRMVEPIRVIRDLPVRKILPDPNGGWTLDFGVNFAGWIRLRISGKAGDRISVTPAEMIRPDGSVDTTSLRNAHPVDTYILKGEGMEEWEPRFTYHGFRYARVTGIDREPDPAMFTGRLVRTAVEETGTFRCSHPIVQGFYDIVKQSEESNLHGVPTDCPQRDERLGWLNDMTVRNEGAMYGFRMARLYSKWLRDIRDAQGKVTGAITDTAPFLRYGFRPADPVSGSFLQLPWNLYLHYGDDRFLLENYRDNGRWVRYLLRNSEKGIVRFSSMGDWASPIANTDPNSTGGGALSVITPPLLMSTGFLYHDCCLMAKMARVLGLTDEEKEWSDTAEKVRHDFNKAFYRSEEGTYATDSQASNVLPLYFGIVEESEIPRVLKHLCDDIERRGGHLSTGNICTRYAIEVLFRNGKEDLAWHLLTQTDYPGWGFMLTHGATSVWERWEAPGDNERMADMASMNHPMNGGAVISLYKHLAGISPDENAPGWKNIFFRPVIPKNAPDASVLLRTVRGTVESSWKRESDGIRWRIVIPGGCTGTVTIPGSGETVVVGNGTHEFRI